jgi:hypothetical protein
MGLDIFSQIQKAEMFGGLDKCLGKTLKSLFPFGCVDQTKR